ncbi:MAG: SRPBCC family protein [Flavobacteriaceae bacterium]|nr:SRPBCC family protein [Flavobacteriaceae bacterium]
MTNVSVTKAIQVSANNAWNTLATFRGIENFSPIAKSVVEGNGEGATRMCYMPDGAEISEVLSILDNDTMHLQYKILSGPFPITNYVSDVNVNALDANTCEITWACSFNTDSAAEGDMIGLFEGFYNVIIDSLEKMLQD